MLKTVPIFFMLASAFQTVWVDKNGHPIAPAEYCKQEVVAPNLTIAQDHTTLHLVLTDPSGSPFADTSLTLTFFKGLEPGIPQNVTKTDQSGSATIANMAKGNYRLLVQPARAWVQPQISCSETDCTWKGTLRIESTDKPFAACPPK
jgi:hypothetical protein